MGKSIRRDVDKVNRNKRVFAKKKALRKDSECEKIDGKLDIIDFDDFDDFDVEGDYPEDWRD